MGPQDENDPQPSSVASPTAARGMTRRGVPAERDDPLPTGPPDRWRGGERDGAGYIPTTAAPVVAARAARHKTVRLTPRVYEVPTLGYLCVQVLVEHAGKIVDLRGVGQDTARQLLEEIMRRQKLTYPLAKVFMDCGDDELASALASLNLWDAMPAVGQGRHHDHL